MTGVLLSRGPARPAYSLCGGSAPVACPVTRNRLPPGWFAPVLAFVLAGCGGASGSPDGSWEAVRDTVGDTIVVRTVGGSVWGEDVRLVEEVRIGRLEGPDEVTFGNVAGLTVDREGFVYVVDSQPPALRKYAPDGSYLMTFGREGKGPGEYGNVDGGVAVLSDGRVLLRDPGNGRITIYAPGGEHLGEWRVRGGMFSSTPMTVDTAGLVYHMLFDFVQSGVRFRFARLRQDGSALDTLPFPSVGYEEPVLVATFGEAGNRSISRRTVPFAPQEHWEVSPLGYFVGGVSDRYAIHLLRPDGPLRIERAVEPLPVHPDEKANVRERTIAAMRRTDPGWDWDGPPIPDVKPPYRRLFVDLDGRIWVQLHVPAEPVPEEELEAEATARPPGGAGRMRPLRWREPVVYDVFEPDGAYLGQVRGPRGLSFVPVPAARGDRLWAVVRDELDVEYVVGFRIERGPPGAASGR